MEKKEFYSLPELAKVMGISRVAVFKKVKNGEIKSKKAGRSYIIPAAFIDASLISEDGEKYGSIEIFKGNGILPGIDVRVVKDNVWLSAAQMASLFGRDKKVIYKHIANVTRDGELDKMSVVAKFATTAADGKKYDMEYYNLDMIISVGYRVKSKAGVRFRVWASGILKKYLLKGYVINENRLKKEAKDLKKLKAIVAALGQAVKLPGSHGMEAELISLIADFSASLEILQDYDDMNLKTPGGSKPVYSMSFEDSLEVVNRAKAEYSKNRKASALFGAGSTGKLKSIIGAVNQTFDGKELYPTTEEKAAHLLYFAVKGHPFTDGNKRLAAILFLHYMSKNGLLYKQSGEKRVSDGALAALTLLAAISNPREKETMINVITNAIGKA